jgi:hypothetical protein
MRADQCEHAFGERVGARIGVPAREQVGHEHRHVGVQQREHRFEVGRRTRPAVQEDDTHRRIVVDRGQSS